VQVGPALSNGGLESVIVRLRGQGLIGLIRRCSELFRIHRWETFQKTSGIALYSSLHLS